MPARQHPKMLRARDRAGGRRSRAALTFAFRFSVGWIFCLILISAFPSIEDTAIRATVGCLAFVLGIPAPGPHTPWNLLHVGAEYWTIVPDCTSLMPTITLSLAMAAFPSSWRWKAAGIAAGAALLWVFNLVRLLVLFFVGTRIPSLSSFVHVYFFQTLAFVVVCISFMLWLKVQTVRRPTS
jgi:exosortase/archaeosortase family protein